MTRKKRGNNKALIVIAKTLGTGVIICTVLLLLVLALPRFLGYETYNIVSDSMEPTISKGTLVLSKQIEPSELSEGDIIVFHSNGIPVCHRVVYNDSFNKTLTTKGDANETEDPFILPYDGVIGIVEHYYPTLGLIGAYISTVSGKLFIIEILTVGILLILIADRIKK